MTLPTQPEENVFQPRLKQRQVLSYRGGKMGVSAVPGSGKTATLSLRAAQILASDVLEDDQEILIVTLVNSAVDKFSTRIGSFARNFGLIPNLGYRVRTLHGLAHDIVRERPGLVNLDNNFQIVDRKGVKTVNGRQLLQAGGQKYRETSSDRDIADFGVPTGIETHSVKTLEPSMFNEEIGQAFGKGQGWPKEAVLVAIRFVGAGLKGNTKSIDVRTPPETQDTATATITESGYLDDAVACARWRLWLTKKAAGTWMINRALWAQLCDRSGRRFYSADRCP